MRAKISPIDSLNTPGGATVSRSHQQQLRVLDSESPEQTAETRRVYEYRPAGIDDVSPLVADGESAVGRFCCGLCCFQGCIWGAVGMFYFFIVLPTGFLLVWHGTNHNYPLTLCLGVALLVAFSCGLPGLFVAVRHVRRQRRKRRKAYEVERNKHVTNATFANSVSLALRDEDTGDAANIDDG